MNWKSYQVYIVGGIALLLGGIIGALLWGWGSSGDQSQDSASTHTHEKNQTWTCSMHPQIKRDEPGDCPICGMDLVPQSKMQEEEGLEGALTMSARALALAQVESVPVREGWARKEVSVTGYVRLDSSTMAWQTVHIGGRVEVLKVEHTGQFIRRGQVVAQLYSPEWTTAQEELIEAYRNRSSRPQVWAALQEKLRNWKISEDRLQAIAEDGEVQAYYTLRAEHSGILLKWKAYKGEYLKQGQALYALAHPHNKVAWLELYPDDLEHVRQGDTVYIQRGRYGKRISATIDWVDPQVNSQTGLGRAKVQLGTVDWALGSRIRAQVQSLLYDDKQVLVPKSAVLWTGPRSVVFIHHIDKKMSGFRSRAIRLGADLGSHYIVDSGLTLGEEVVAQGVFSLDAAAQLEGLPSMMQKPKGKSTEGSKDIDVFSVDLSKEEKKHFHALVGDYLSIKRALVGDRLKPAQQTSQAALKSWPVLKPQGKVALAKQRLFNTVRHSLESIQEARDIGAAREAFRKLSPLMWDVLEKYPLPGDSLFVQFCPMANDNKGAYWLSRKSVIKNPYFGASMLHCGEVRDTLQDEREP